jgi:hypothetical protein
VDSDPIDAVSLVIMVLGLALLSGGLAWGAIGRKRAT